MKIGFEYSKGLYHFIWIKGIIEIIMAFFLLYGVAMGNAVLQSRIIMTILIIILLFFGFSDLNYFIRLQERCLIESHKDEVSEHG